MISFNCREIISRLRYTSRDFNKEAQRCLTVNLFSGFPGKLRPSLSRLKFTLYRKHMRTLKFVSAGRWTELINRNKLVSRLYMCVVIASLGYH